MPEVTVSSERLQLARGNYEESHHNERGRGSYTSDGHYTLRSYVQVLAEHAVCTQSRHKKALMDRERERERERADQMKGFDV